MGFGSTRCENGSRLVGEVVVAGDDVAAADSARSRLELRGIPERRDDEVAGDADEVGLALRDPARQHRATARAPRDRGTPR